MLMPRRAEALSSADLLIELKKYFAVVAVNTDSRCRTTLATAVGDCTDNRCRVCGKLCSTRAVRGGI